MARVPIIRVGAVLIAAVQADLNDRDAITLQDDLSTMLEATSAEGVLIDLSTVDLVDSFLGRLLNDVATGSRLLGAETVVVGIQPAVAITLVELGLNLSGIQTALSSDKGLSLLHRRIHARRRSGLRHA
jgi:rsbT antagonist protein RsbS